MKKDIHPQYYAKAKIACSCGKVHTIGSTRESMEIEICSACHPFFTGQEKLIDKAGRVERFKSKRATAEAHKVAKKTKKVSVKVPKVPVAKKKAVAKKTTKTSRPRSKSTK
jgi:large subunit ribosomal protein L31